LPQGVVGVREFLTNQDGKAEGMEVMNEESAGTGVLISWGKRSLEYTRDRLEEVALYHERRSIFWLLVLPIGSSDFLLYGSQDYT
jgi:hypothetical protein